MIVFFKKTENNDRAIIKCLKKIRKVKGSLVSIKINKNIESVSGYGIFTIYYVLTIKFMIQFSFSYVILYRNPSEGKICDVIVEGQFIVI